MEGIEFRYVFKDGKKDAKEVRAIRQDENDEGLRANDICEMFVDFMTSAGFAEECIYRYFNT